MYLRWQLEPSYDIVKHENKICLFHFKNIAPTRGVVSVIKV